jgi:hypothetical protein
MTNPPHIAHHAAARWTPVVVDLDPVPVQLTSPQDRSATWVGEGTSWASEICRATGIQRAALLVDYTVRLAGRPDLIAAERRELAGRNLGCPCPIELACHRSILIDFAQPPADTYTRTGHTLAVAVPRPWASLTLMPDALSANMIHTRSWSTDYRGPLCVLARRKADDNAYALAQRLGFDADRHTAQHGWIGAAVLLDVSPRSAPAARPGFDRVGVTTRCTTGYSATAPGWPARCAAAAPWAYPPCPGQLWPTGSTSACPPTTPPGSHRREDHPPQQARGPHPDPQHPRPPESRPDPGRHPQLRLSRVRVDHAQLPPHRRPGRDLPATRGPAGDHRRIPRRGRPGGRQRTPLFDLPAAPGRRR